MPMTFYADTNQISKRVNKYEFKLPTFGESRTDPTYYEPTATRIANMRKSASAGLSLFDYDGSNFADIANNPNLTQEQKLTEYAKRLDVSTKNHFVEPAREIGITREEISQIQSETASKIDKNIKEAREIAEENKKEVLKFADMAKVTKSVLNDDVGNVE